MYVSCTESARSGRDQHRDWFGDGMQWAGCTIIALMDQRERFEACDFSYHVSRAYEMDEKASACDGISVEKFVNAARSKASLNDQIFAVLEKYLQGPGFKPPTEYFPPPGAEPDLETTV